MASSGYMNTSNQYVKYWIEVITNSQNVANNTSNVTVKVWAKRTNTGYTTWGSGSVTLKVNGSYHNSGNKQIEITSSSKVYHSWTGNITHNGDGTKNLSCAAAINIPSVLSSSEQGYSENLKTIPRTSSFTLSKNSCELGTSFTVNISRASSNFTHAVTFTIGGEKRYIQNSNNSSISPSYTPPITDAVYMPNSTSMNAVIGVETYSGGTHIGSTTKNITLTCPSNLIPTFTSVSAVKVASGTDSNVTCLVQGYSKIKATINGAKGIHGSTISKHYVSINEINYNGGTNVYTSGVITNPGDINVRAEVLDSRGRKSGVYGTTIRVEPYSKPFASDVIVRRVNSDYSYNPEGIYIQVKATKNYSSLNGENTCDMVAWWRKAGGSWSQEYELDSNSNFNFGGTTFSNDERYEVCIRVKDKISVVDTYYSVSTGDVTMDFKKGGKGVAIGKVSENDNMFDVNFATFIRDNITVDKDLILKGNLHHNDLFSDGKGYYHNTLGCLITTNIKNTQNTMFELYITGNGYGTQRPIDIKINGYIYQGDIINRSCLVNSYNIPIYVFLTAGGYLGFWLKQASDYTTLRFTLGAFNSSTHNYRVENAPKPTNNIKEYLLDNIISYTTKHSFIVDMGGDDKNKYARFDNGLQICWGHTYEFIDFPHTYGSLKYSNTKISITFSAPFSEQPRGSLVMHSSLGGFCTIDGKSTTALTGYIYNAIQVSAWVSCEYIMIGRWK